MSGESDPAYGASFGVMAAARATLASGTRATSEPYHLVLPVIVVDTPVFEAGLDASGAVALHEVEESKFLFGWGHEDRGPTCVHVVSIYSLEEFAVRQLEVAQELISLVERKPHDQRARNRSN